MTEAKFVCVRGDMQQVAACALFSARLSAATYRGALNARQTDAQPLTDTGQRIGSA